MADIILNKPEAGTQAVFEAAGDSRIDLNFPTDQATLERSGNDLIFHFDDGSTVVLRDFYTAYTKDSMPDFVIEGTPIFPLRRMVGRTLETVHPRRRTGRLLPPQPQSRMGGLAPVRQPLCTARCRHDGKGRLALLRLHRHHRYRVPGSLFGTVPSIIR